LRDMSVHPPPTLRDETRLRLAFGFAYRFARVVPIGRARLAECRRV
jgi:hypothetical protein